MASRHRSRELAVQLCYQLDLDPKSFEKPSVFERFWQEQAQASDDTRDFFEYVMRGVVSNLPQIDSDIKETLVNWRLSRIEKVDLAILRCAVFELLYGHEAPEVVVIDEAIEISKRFGTKDSPSFINGVLDTLRKKKAKKKTGS